MSVKKIIKLIIYGINNLDKRKVNIKSMDSTIDKIINDRVSVSRIGDGEFKWIYGLKQDSFEKNNKQMSKRLKQILKSNESNLIVCIPDGFTTLDIFTDEAKKWWEDFIGKYRILFFNMLDRNKTYYNLYITRPYMDFKDKSGCEEHFKKMKEIWKDRNIIIVEGKKTRLGVGNNLFDSSRSIRRIVCPPTNAYVKYDQIYNMIVQSYSDDDLILIALGPTATILAYDLSRINIQSIDIGHIDVEYEWFKMQAVTKEPIVGKYVNEAKIIGGTEVSDEIVNERYLNEIIGVINE